MAYKRFELLSKPLTSYPIHHIATVGSAKGHGAVGVHERHVRFYMCKTLCKVMVWAAALITFTSADKVVAKGSGTTRVRHHNDVSLTTKHSWIPESAPRIGPRTDRPTVNKKGQRVLFVGLKTSRLYYPCLNIIVAVVLERDLGNSERVKTKAIAFPGGVAHKRLSSVFEIDNGKHAVRSEVGFADEELVFGW